MDPNNTSIEKIKRRIGRIKKRFKTLTPEDVRRLNRIEASPNKPNPEDVLWVEAFENRQSP